MSVYSVFTPLTIRICGVYWSSSTRIRGVDMIVIVGLVVLLVAVIVGFTGVLTNVGGT